MRLLLKKFLKNNVGVSMVELLIVTAIMVVIGSGIGISYNLVTNRNATQCAENIKISLEKHKTSVMGQKKGRIVFYRDEKGAIWMQEDFNTYDEDAFEIVPARSTKIGKKDVSVYFGGAELTTSPVMISFKRSGALGDGADALTPIVVKKGSKVYNIEIEPLTGKIKLSK